MNRLVCISPACIFHPFRIISEAQAGKRGPHVLFYPVVGLKPLKAGGRHVYSTEWAMIRGGRHEKINHTNTPVNADIRVLNL
jgi:hypothetical protein